MTKRVVLVIVLAILVTVGIYVGLAARPHEVPEVDYGFGILEPTKTIRSNEGSFELIILNGKDCDKLILVGVERQEYASWFSLPDGPLDIEAGGNCTLEVPYSIPEGVNNQEVGLLLIDLNGGTLKTGIRSRLYIRI